MRARQLLAVSGRQIAQAMQSDNGADNLSVTLVKDNTHAMSLRIRANDETAFLKVYNESASGAYSRERDVLAQMQGSGLVPGLMAFSDSHTWLLLQDIPQGKGDPATMLAPADFGYRLGIWLARFEAKAPSRHAAGNWYAYLAKTGLGAQIDAIQGARDTLLSIPLCEEVLSRNDAALHNSLLTGNGELVGCDFETCSLKPRGWEFVTTWQSLLQRYGDQSGPVIEAFAAGFHKAHQGYLMAEELNAIAGILLCARAQTASVQIRAAA